MTDDVFSVSTVIRRMYLLTSCCQDEHEPSVIPLQKRASVSVAGQSLQRFHLNEPNMIPEQKPSPLGSSQVIHRQVSASLGPLLRTVLWVSCPLLTEWLKCSRCSSHVGFVFHTSNGLADSPDCVPSLILSSRLQWVSVPDHTEIYG